MEGKVKGKEREVEREAQGREEEEGHRVVRPMGTTAHGGKGSKGRAANGIGQKAPPAADENNTPPSILKSDVHAHEYK